MQKYSTQSGHPNQQKLLKKTFLKNLYLVFLLEVLFHKGKQWDMLSVYLIKTRIWVARQNTLVNQEKSLYNNENVFCYYLYKKSPIIIQERNKIPMRYPDFGRLDTKLSPAAYARYTVKFFV